MDLIFNLVIAIVPTIILCFYVYKMDVIEKEPTNMLLRLFFLGILITIPVAFIEQSFLSFTGLEESDYLNCFIISFFIVALVEELFKYVVLYLGTWNNKHFDHIYDAIVYAVFISLGFATLENILYVVESINVNSLQVGIMRALISVPAHAFYAVASGYYLGLAKLNHSIGYRKNEIFYKTLSLLIPILMHGIFDFFLLTGNQLHIAFFYGFVAILYFVSYFNIKKTSSVQMTSSLQDLGGDKDEGDI
ncbi:MAG: PrsW family intramembrane metalloprotease [Bacilli bacterium]|nr:PrsW family intramembrane metalloprotease [Bacilli bacterium]